MGISCTCLVLGRGTSFPLRLRHPSVVLSRPSRLPRAARRTCWPCAKCLLRCPRPLFLSLLGDHLQMTSTKLLGCFTISFPLLNSSSLPSSGQILVKPPFPFADIICKSPLPPSFSAADVLAAIWPIPFSHCPQGAPLFSLQKSKKSRPSFTTAACFHFLQGT